MINWGEVRNFREGEFKHPELLDPLLIEFMDEVRSRFGVPIRTTFSLVGVRSDARTKPSDIRSLHYANLHGSGRLCRALDYIFDGIQLTPEAYEQLFRLTVIHRDIGNKLNVSFEFEVVPYKDSKPGKRFHHLHTGIFHDKRPNRLVVFPQE